MAKPSRLSPPEMDEMILKGRKTRQNSDNDYRSMRTS